MSAMPLDFSSRKRKDFDEEDQNEPIFERRSGIKGVRTGFHMIDSTQEAQFHPLPQDLNLQLLANLGYNTNTYQHTDIQKHQVNNRPSNHSPSSSASDICPSTPVDNMSSSVESYFTKGINSDSASYPNFDIYPGHIYPRPPGLLGMLMTQSKSAQSFDSDADVMDLDGGPCAGGAPVHGSHCKSIPQLMCRGSGECKELWAQCRDCGTMSQVDCPPIPEPLAYSP